MTPAPVVTAIPPVTPGMPFRQLLDEAVRQTRRFFRRIYPAVALPIALMAAAVPLAQGLLFRDIFAAAGAGRPPEDPARMAVEFAGFGLVMIAFLVVWGLSYAAMFAAAIDAVAGRGVSMRRAWRLVARPKVLGTLLLAGLAVFFGALFCLLPGLYLGLVYAFTVPAMADESRFGTAALARSSSLARYNTQHQFDSDPRLHVFIIFIVGTLLGYMINLLFQIPFVVVQQFMVWRDVAGGHAPDPARMMARLTWIQVPTNVINMLTNTAVHLYVCFGLALLFFDIKRRKEGLDLEAAVAALLERRRARRPA